ncbi:26S proteasome regulatory subunit RPN12 [Nakaseomyces bracarensis]|uniref:26S proteasome regulatory subunit RPN12 n=1 Tax=Nakaseomyces bracarensis TaxID=273131 RepID=A0ABR4NNA4_9SACH
MAPNLSELSAKLYQSYTSKDYEVCKKLLPAIKIELIKNGILIPDLNKDSPEYIKDLTLTRKILELGALVSIHVLDFESFYSFFTQLRMFYFSSSNVLNNSEERSKIVSLYLLTLLSDGDVTKFHSELEFFDKHIQNIEEDQLLSYPIKVDRWLMEGSYQKAWDLLEAGSKVPEFDVFTKTLMKAVREEIARNTELAYDKLPLSSIKALLFFNNEKETESFAKERDWKISRGYIIFEEEATAETPVEALDIVDKTLDYSINIESIV